MKPKKVYIDATVLTDALLKPNSQGALARQALELIPETILPVYAIKEFKAGPLGYYIWLHNKFVSTKSLKMTLNAIDSIIGYQNNRAKTALGAYTDLLGASATTARSDEDLAAIYRRSLAKLIVSAWRKRRKLTSNVSNELSCYSEASPVIEAKNGMYDNPECRCRLYGNEECCLAKTLKTMPRDLSRLIKCIEGREGREQNNRRAVLHKLHNTPKRVMDARDCGKLGDAFYALCAPSDAPILTTNLKDHLPLATALGKTAISPVEVASMSEDEKG